jgi:hypothetical protein
MRCIEAAIAHSPQRLLLIAIPVTAGIQFLLFSA